MNDWIKQFDKEFGIIGQITSNLDLDDYHQYLHQDIKSFIQELLDKQREELREWAESGKAGITANSGRKMGQYEATFVLGYNAAINDLLTKLEKK